MNRPSRRLASGLLAATLAAAVGGGTALAYQDSANKAISAEWSYVDDNYYTAVKFPNHNTLLIKRLQEKDRNHIQESLIDRSIEPDTELAKLAANDPDAVLPDNMLPDGSYLVDNWESKYEKLLDETLDAKSLRLDSNGAVTLNEVQTTRPKLTKNALEQNTLATTQVTLGDSILTIPLNLDTANGSVTVLPEDRSVLAATDSTLALVDSKGESKVISPVTYNGKTYQELAQESTEKFGENLLFWNGQVSVNQDNHSAAYVSNKADLSGTWDLFMLDLQTGTETKLADDPDHHYFVEQWIDKTHVLCSKTWDTDYEMVLVDTNGREVHPDFAVDRPVILGARDDLIAYGNEANDTIYFARFAGSSTLQTLGQLTLNGTFRIRPGIDPFNPDGTKFAYILNPKDDYYGRDIVVVDLGTMTQQTNRTVPLGSKRDTGVLEFSWLDNDNLLTSVLQDQTEISSWVYHVK